MLARKQAGEESFTTRPVQSLFQMGERACVSTTTGIAGIMTLPAEFGYLPATTSTPLSLMLT
eukprot:52983-Eustigmatos_ZCMA.PRE.1